MCFELKRVYLDFLNSIVPSGVVSSYLKSASRSCLALSLSVVVKHGFGGYE